MEEKDREQRLIQPINDIDQLIHSPARLMIMTYLFVVESIDFVYLQRVTGLSWGNISKHVTKLEEAGYVATEKTFIDKKPNTSLSLTAAGREALLAYRQTIQGVLNNLPDA